MNLGVAKADITPLQRVPLGGYQVANRYSEGVLHPIYARGFVMDGEGGVAALALLEVLGLREQLVAQIQSQIKTNTGIPSNRVIIACTHTHSGPDGLVVSPDIEPLPQTIMDDIVRSTVECLTQAANALKPVILHIGRQQVTGVCSDRSYPERCCPNELLVLSGEHTNGRQIAFLANYSCHPTVLGPSNRLINGDLFGHAMAQVERTRSGALCGLTNGASANISTRFTRRKRTIDEMEQLATQLSDAILEAEREGTAMSSSVIRSASRTLRLYVPPSPPTEVCSSLLAAYMRDVKRARRDDISPGEVRHLESLVEGARLRLERSRGVSNEAGTFEEISITGLRVGDIVFVTVPGELPSSVGQRICDCPPPGITVAVLGLANGYVGYFPDLDGGESYENITSRFTAEASRSVQFAASSLIHELANAKPT